MCEALGKPPTAADPNYKTNALRQKHHGKLERRSKRCLARNPRRSGSILGKAGIPCGPINNIKQALEHPQVAARNMLVSVPDGSGGTAQASPQSDQDVGLRRSTDAGQPH